MEAQLDTLETRLRGTAAAYQPRGMGGAGRSRRLLPADRAFRLGRPGPDAQLGAGARHDRPDADQPVGADVRRDHCLEPAQGRHRRQPDRAVGIRADQCRGRDPWRDLSGRPDVQCVVHTHTEADIAVGVLEEGLLPLSQWAMRFYGRLGYHDYEGVSLEMDERERLAHDIGQHPVLVLRNHGLLATGRNVAEAFSLTYHFERSAEAQLKIQAAAAAGSKSSCRRRRPANGRRRNLPATCRARRASANGRRCCGCATVSTRAIARSCRLSMREAAGGKAISIGRVPGARLLRFARSDSR